MKFKFKTLWGINLCIETSLSIQISYKKFVYNYIQLLSDLVSFKVCGVYCFAHLVVICVSQIHKYKSAYWVEQKHD